MAWGARLSPGRPDAPSLDARRAPWWTRRLLLRQLNLLLNGFGLALFGLLLWVLLAAPAAFDALARDLAVSEVADRLSGLQGSLAEAPAAQGGIPDRLRGTLPETPRDRLSSLERLTSPEEWEEAVRLIAALCEPGCERAAAARARIPALTERFSAELAVAEGRIEAFVLGQFQEVMAEIRRDLTLFSATNAALFLASFLLGIFRGRASAHFLPISVLLTGTTLFTAGLYLFGQDWLLTVVFSDYWGMAYPVFAGILALFLVDIAFFRARITSNVISAFGSAFSVLPC